MLRDSKKPRVFDDDLEHGYYDYKYKGQPYTGYVVLEYYTEGSTQQVAVEFEVVNGEKCGWYREYYPNGTPKVEWIGVGEIVLKYYEYDEEGVCTFAREYGTPESFKKYYDNYRLPIDNSGL